MVKMKKASCCGVVVLAALCFLLSAFGAWPLSGNAENVGTMSPSSHRLQQEEEEGSGVTRETDEEKDEFYNYPHPQETLTEGLPYRFFDSEVTYQTEGAAGRGLTNYEETLLTHAKSTASAHLAHSHPHYTFLNGRYRWIPDGVEYDLMYKEGTGQSTSLRVTMFQKLQQAKVIKAVTVSDDTVVNMVVTLQGRLDKYATFLDHLVKNVLPHDPNLALTVVYFSDDLLQETRDLTNNRLSGLPSFKWSFIPLEENNFSRGYGLHMGAQEKSSKDTGELLFFCDVDVLMHPDFFSRCRSNTKKGHQVYYPVVFSLYNPKLVYPLFDKVVPAVHEQLVVDEQSGFWRTFGFGMTCMYRSDYEASGGFPDIRTWGGEDVALYQQFLQMDKYKVIRAPDPSLFHLYHRKDCKDTGSTSYPACLKSKAITEGSQLQLGLTLLRVHDGTDLEGILSKRFYYFWLVPYLGFLLVISLVTNLVQALLLLNKHLRGRFRSI